MDTGGPEGHGRKMIRVTHSDRAPREVETTNAHKLMPSPERVAEVTVEVMRASEVATDDDLRTAVIHQLELTDEQKHRVVSAGAERGTRQIFRIFLKAQAGLQQIGAAELADDVKSHNEEPSQGRLSLRTLAAISVDRPISRFAALIETVA